MMSQNIVPWWYLYRNLDLSKASDKEEYGQVQKDRNLILEYQTKTSSAVNKFIDTIHQDLLDACKKYGTGYETNRGTYYEKDVCVDRYIRNLYQKLKTELNNPQKNYAWKDPVLLSYYQDLGWDHLLFVILWICIRIFSKDDEILERYQNIHWYDLLQKIQIDDIEMMKKLEAI